MSESKSAECAESKGAYEKTVEKFLQKAPERKKAFRTGGGLPLKRIYTPEDLEGLFSTDHYFRWVDEIFARFRR